MDKELFQEIIDSIITHWVLILYFTFFSLLGGISSYIKRVKENGKEFNIFAAIGESVVCFGLSITTFLICKGYDIPELVCIGLSGLIAHFGTRWIVISQVVFLIALQKVLKFEVTDMNETKEFIDKINNKGK